MSEEPARLGRYEIIRTLGHGAMGVVHEGFDRVIERRVAIKTVRIADLDADEAAEHSRRFLIEARAAGKLNHPHIVSLFDQGEQDGTAYLVMELVVGRELQQWFDDGHRFALGETLRLMGELLDALGYSHRQGVIHRDVKPANIFVTESGSLKLGDFGIARIESAQKTRAGLAIGTPTHMAPEQIRGEMADARSDLYAAGVVLFELLTGSRPFSGTMLSMALKVLNEPAPLPSSLEPGVSPALDAVVAKALAKSPADRFQTAEAFWRALTAAAGVAAPPSTLLPAPPAPVAASSSPVPVDARLATSALDVRKPAPVTAVPAPVLPAAAPPASGRIGSGKKPILGLVGVVLLLVLVGVGWWLRSGPPDAPQPPVAGHEPRALPDPAVPSASAAPPPAAPVMSMMPPPTTGLPDADKPAADRSRVANQTPTTLPALTLPLPAPAAEPLPPPARQAPRRDAAAARPSATPTRPNDVQRVAKSAAARETGQPPAADPQTSRSPSARGPLPARCSDILLKASLEPLTIEESRYLRRECQ